MEGEQTGTVEVVGEPEPLLETDYTIDGYVTDVFAACIAIGAILPVGGVIIASIIRSVLLVVGFGNGKEV